MHTIESFEKAMKSLELEFETAVDVESLGWGATNKAVARRVMYR